MSYKKTTAAHPKIGETPGPTDPPGIYSLNLEEWFEGLIKKAYCDKGGCSGKMDSTVNALSYFITSGEAVKKAEALNKDAWEFAGRCRSLLASLKKARGEAVYLEVTSEDGLLVCRRKDPRKRPDAEPESI